MLYVYRKPGNLTVMRIYDLHGYKCIAQGKHSNKGGLMIYVDNKYKTELKCHINMYEHWEGLIIEIKGGCLSKTITIGNIYRPPKTTNDSLNVYPKTFGDINSLNVYAINTDHMIVSTLFVTKIIKLVLAIFSESLLTWNQICSLSSSVDTVSHTCDRLSPE